MLLSFGQLFHELFVAHGAPWP
eukprot:COSAG02_NODE_42283_length_386_cov_0.505226_1_plen_21_part_10